MTKEELFEQWIKMVESGEIEIPGLRLCALEHREVLRATFYSGVQAALIVVPS